MIKSYLKTIIREGKGKYGIGLEMFRLDAVGTMAEGEGGIELTELEQEAVNVDGGDAIIRIYEDIGENFWTGEGTSAKKFAEALDGFKDIKKLNIHINSLGGDTHTAQAIYNLIGDFSGETESYVDGIAASAATVVACGAQRVVMRKNANYMIHQPWTICMGNAEVMRKAAEDLDQVTEPIIGVYKTQTGNKTSRDRIIELMTNETWLTADEALDMGFVNEVRGKGAVNGAGKGLLMVNGRVFNAARYGFRHIPDFQPITKSPIVSKLKAKTEKVSIKTEEPKKKKVMTIQELEQDDPEAAAQLKADIAKEEKDRILSLNAMMAPGLEAIIAKAIEDGSQPASIAMQCFNVMREQNTIHSAVDGLKRDTAPLGNVPAGNAPYEPPAPNTPTKPKPRAFKALAEAFQKGRDQDARKTNNGRLLLS